MTLSYAPMRWTGNPTVHFAFEVLAYFAAAGTYAALRARRGDTIRDSQRATVLIAAAIGATIGTRLLACLAYPHIPFFSGKTIVGGLLGGLIAVEVTKKIIGVTRSTGDLYVVPLIVAISIGRIGCFLAGPIDRTAGKASSLPWAVAIADGVPRHPVALYEILFVLLLLPFVRRPRSPEGENFRMFMLAYLTFRLFVDFLKPDPPPMLGPLSLIQCACVAGILYYVGIFVLRLWRPRPGLTSSTTP
jgi:prolipoprotein diacylglyceryltransferase